MGTFSNSYSSTTLRSKNDLSDKSSNETCSQKNNATTQFSISKTRRRKSTFPFGECKVCEDKSSGIHYGISTCEGCKVKNIL